MKKTLIILLLMLLALVQYCNAQAQPYQIDMEELTMKATPYTEVSALDGILFFRLSKETVNMQINDKVLHTIDVEIFYYENGIVKSLVFSNVDDLVWNEKFEHLLIKMPNIPKPNIIALEDTYRLKKIPFSITIH